MCRNSIFTKRWVKGSAVLVATAATLVFANPQQAIATPLKGVDSATVSQSASNVVDIDFADGRTPCRRCFGLRRRHCLSKAEPASL